MSTTNHHPQRITSPITLVEFYLRAVLSEGRWDDLKTRADTTEGMSGYSHTFWDYKNAGVHPKYADLFWKTFVAGGGGPLPSPSAVGNVLRRFEELAKIKPEGFVPDISTFESFFDVVKHVNRFDAVKSKTKERSKASEGAKTVWSDKDWLLQEIHTMEASCQYGKGTKWCISGTPGDGGSGNWFNRYYQKLTDFWFLTHKPSGKKWAISHDPNGVVEVFDAADNSISLDDLNKEIQETAGPAGVPPDLSGHIARITGMTLSDRILANPGRALRDLGPRLNPETVIQLVVYANSASPGKLTQENLDQLLRRLDLVDPGRLKQILDLPTLEQVRTFLRRVSFSDPELTQGVLMSLDNIETPIRLKDPNLSEEEFRNLLAKFPESSYPYLPSAARRRVAEVLSSATSRLTETEERGLWRILKQGNLTPATVDPEVFLRLADTSRFPYDFRQAVANTLMPWAGVGWYREWLSQILGGSRTVEAFLAEAPPVDTDPATLGSRDFDMWELARDLHAYGNDPVRLAVAQATQILENQGTGGPR